MVAGAVAVEMADTFASETNLRARLGACRDADFYFTFDGFDLGYCSQSGLRKGNVVFGNNVVSPSLKFGAGRNLGDDDEIFKGDFRTGIDTRRDFDFLPFVLNHDFFFGTFDCFVERQVENITRKPGLFAERRFAAEKHFENIKGVLETAEILTVAAAPGIGLMALITKTAEAAEWTAGSPASRFKCAVTELVVR